MIFTIDKIDFLVYFFVCSNYTTAGNPATGGGVRKILIVDDQPLNTRAIGRILRKDGYEVVEASDGVEGARLFEADLEIVLVISDTDMPNMDGEEMYRRIKGELTRRNVPIIIMSGELQREGLQDLPFLRKPFGTAELRELVTKLIA